MILVLATLIGFLFYHWGFTEANIITLYILGYCIDISNQISASTALLKKANQHILSGHLHSCVLTAIEERDAEEKVSEIEAVIAALLK